VGHFGGRFLHSTSEIDQVNKTSPTSFEAGARFVPGSNNTVLPPTDRPCSQVPNIIHDQGGFAKLLFPCPFWISHSQSPNRNNQEIILGHRFARATTVAAPAIAPLTLDGNDMI
jgi:hypothetical protein